MPVCTLTGRQFALLGGAMTTFIGYPFSTAAAAARRARFSLDMVGSVDDVLIARWRSALREHGLDSAEEWQRRSYSARGSISVTAEFSTVELAVAEAAIGACEAEFGENWTEFLIVAPGALDRYELQRFLRTLSVKCTCSGSASSSRARLPA